MPKNPQSAEATLKRFMDQQQGYLIAMRLVMTLLAAGREVSVDAALALAKQELEPSAFFSHKELFQSVIGAVAASAARLRAGQAQSE